MDNLLGDTQQASPVPATIQPVIVPLQSKPVPNDTGSNMVGKSDLPPSITVGGKEGEIAPLTPELPLKAVGQEIQLPKEIEAAGVSVTPQTIVLPHPVIAAGVKSVGANVPIAVTPQTTHIPLSDEQIAGALHESMKTSIRWLAEWCVRQIKIVQGAVKTH